ncbi:MAG: hypothetical protein ACTSRK_16915 [Promethearchaeota archaeon]
MCQLLIPNRNPTCTRVWKEEPTANFLRHFDLNDQRAIIADHGYKINLTEEKYEGFHGCFYCPYRPEWYYAYLRTVHPVLYAEANRLRGCASEKWGNDYHYYRDSKIM